MKKFNHLLSALAILFGFMFCMCTSEQHEHTTAVLSDANIRASEGDTVWVILNHVKPDRREVFERFLVDVFWPKSADLTPSDQQTFKQTRVLFPAEMNEDSTYTYVFLMDPVIPNHDYDILNMLKKMYGEDEADEYYKMFTESLNSQEGYAVVQSQY